MHLFPLIRDLALILGLAGVVSLVFQRIRQPLVLGYLVAGVIAGPHTPPFSLILDMNAIRVWAELGVIFLMFSLGLEFNFKRLMSVGWTAAFTGPFEAVAMVALGFGAGRLFGWGNVDSVFLGSILAISSTTIIIKSLDEMGLKREKFAELVFGVLVVEDLAGILLLVALSTLGEGKGISGGTMAWEALKLILTVAIWISLGLLTVPRFISYVGRRASNETLLLVSLALCLGLVVFAAHFHYSAALGAFVMGSIVAESDQLQRIEHMLDPVRNLFGAVFFVSIGMLLDPRDVMTHWKIILVVAALTVAGKIASTSAAARFTGQDRATSLQMGFSLAQIGEFAFIIAGLGIALGVMNPLLYSIAVAVSVLTTFTTPYLIRVSRRLAGC